MCVCMCVRVCVRGCVRARMFGRLSACERHAKRPIRTHTHVSHHTTPTHRGIGYVAHSPEHPAKTFAESCPTSGETFDVRRGTCNRIITHTRAQAQTRATHTLLHTRHHETHTHTQSQNTGEPVDQVEKLNVCVHVRACVRAWLCSCSYVRAPVCL